MADKVKEVKAKETNIATNTRVMLHLSDLHLGWSGYQRKLFARRLSCES